MSFTRILLTLFAVALGIPAFYVVFFGLNLFVVGPLKHVWNTHRAESTNQTTWETGFADVYTIEATIEMNNEMYSASMDVSCVSKVETKTINFKDGGPFVWTTYQNLNQQGLSIPLPENYSVVFDTKSVCAGIVYQVEEKGFPFSFRRYQIVDIQQIVEPFASCRISLYEDIVQTKMLRLFPLTVLSMRTERVRDVLTRDEYGPTDRAVARERARVEPIANKFSVPNENNRGWSSDAMC
ncbi:MAG: hypothetical protein JKY41_09895 [Rhodobacteraceae bacterium]|nr:hypothetical protein [Paracoccaceae bacterium]